MKRYEVIFELILEFLIILFQIMLCIWIVPKTLGYFWPFVTGWIISVITWPIISYMNQKMKMNRRFVSVFILVFFLAVVAGLLCFVFVSLGQELVSLMADIPKIYQMFSDVMKDVPAMIMNSEWIPDALKGNMDTILAGGKEAVLSVVNQIGEAGVSYAGPIAKNVTNFLIGFIVSILSAYFFVHYREKMSDGYSSILSVNLQERLNDVVSHIKGALGGYVIAQLKIMGIIFVILLAGLMISGNHYSIILALLISFLDVIPFFGTGFVLMPWAVYDLFAGNYSLVLLRVVLYLTCLLARQLLQPRIIGESVGLDPFLTLLLIYVGFKMDGIRGFLIAMIAGIIILNFYKMGLFDKKIERIKHLFMMLNEANEKLIE